MKGNPWWSSGSVSFSSVTQLCPTLCNPMNCSTPGLPVHHQLPEFTQTYVHGVRDAIQPSHLLDGPLVICIFTAKGHRSIPGSGNCLSVTKSGLTLCNSIDCSKPGSSVLYYLLKFTQIHVYWVVMLSNHLSLCCPLLLFPSIFPSIRVSSHELAPRIRWPNYLSFSFSISISPSSEYSGLISLRIDSPCSPRDSQESLPAWYFKSINSLVISLPYNPTLTSVHDYWKNHTFDYMDLCQQNDVSAF